MEQLLLSISRYWIVTLDQIIHLLLGKGEEGGREGGRERNADFTIKWEGGKKRHRIMSEEWIRERKERERTNLNCHIDIHIFIIPLSLPLSLSPSSL